MPHFVSLWCHAEIKLYLLTIYNFFSILCPLCHLNLVSIFLYSIFSFNFFTSVPSVPSQWQYYLQLFEFISLTLPAVIRLWAFCAGCPPPPEHTQTKTHKHSRTTARASAVNHGLTWRTGDGPVIKAWCYHSSSHLWSPPPSSSLTFSSFLSQCLFFLFPHAPFFPVKLSFPQFSFPLKPFLRFVFMQITDWQFYQAKLQAGYCSRVSFFLTEMRRLILFAQMKLKRWILAGDLLLSSLL